MVFLRVCVCLSLCLRVIVCVVCLLACLIAWCCLSLYILLCGFALPTFVSGYLYACVCLYEAAYLPACACVGLPSSICLLVPACQTVWVGACVNLLARLLERVLALDACIFIYMRACVCGSASSICFYVGVRRSFCLCASFCACAYVRECICVYGSIIHVLLYVYW